MLTSLLLAVVALGAAGCTQAQSAKNDFTGDDKAVAQVVLDLASDAQR
ncbi:MAG: hypothetical protein QOI80_3780 [Solirubrobacteraceae bacterium]|nr:hypothetical protein [Solirubrobacteraceae bacterium]